MAIIKQTSCYGWCGREFDVVGPRRDGEHVRCSCHGDGEFVRCLCLGDGKLVRYSTREMVRDLEIVRFLRYFGSWHVKINYMASAQVDVAHVEEFTKPSAETTLGSQTIEESTKAPAPQNAESPYDEDDEDVILPDELDKEEDLDHEEDQNDLAPQIIEDEVEDEEDEDDKEQDEEPASKSGTDYLDDEDDDEED
nr:hypothetical protein [Tanacetum cinerariifolium]GEW77945.1 hypothetical protein [Tanacetum cinerariifolium]